MARPKASSSISRATEPASVHSARSARSTRCAAASRVSALSRLFVGLWPDAAVINRLEALDRPKLHGVRWTTSDQWHVTLQFLGEQSENEMVDRLSEGRWVGLPMKVRLGPSAELLGSEAAVLPARAPGLDALANRVTELTGVARMRPFKGHLTLARARGRATRRSLEPVAGIEFEDSWTAPSVVLVRSTLTPEGARYETVEEFLPRS